MTDISSSTATGSLLRELFNDFPQENILQITVQVSEDEIAQKYSNRHRILASRTRAQLIARVWPVKTILKIFKKTHSGLLSEITKFDPDLVYVRVEENLYPYRELAELISEKFEIPIVTHTMDDYESLIGFFPFFWRRVVKSYFFRKDLKFLLGLARFNLVISSAMNESFQKKYGGGFEVFHNGIDAEQWLEVSESGKCVKTVGRSATPFKITMAGSIDKKKDATIISQVARVVHKLNVSGDLKCELILNVPRAFFATATLLAENCSGVIAQKYQPLNEYRKLLSNSNCLLLARNSDEVTKAYTGLSFHNKLPEYLASGTLILCIGPAWDGSVQFLKENCCGVVMSNPRDADIRRKIMAMAMNPRQFKAYSKKAKEVAMEFDIHQVRARFRQCLYEAIGICRSDDSNCA